MRERNAMPRIIVEAVHTDGEPRRWTLSERIVTDNLATDRYADHLIERLSWATADAEAIEAGASDVETDRQDGLRPGQLPRGSRDDRRSRSGSVRASRSVRR
jgi:hypothetical protein